MYHIAIKTEDFEYQFKIIINTDNPADIFSYIKYFILNFPPFNLINQPNLSKDIKKKLKSKVFVESLTNISNVKQIDLKNQKELHLIKTHSEKITKIHYFNEYHIDDAGSLFDFIIQNDDYKQIFEKEISNIINIMDEIIFTPPYPILFGRMFIEKQCSKKNLFAKDIDKSFYEGIEIDEFTKST